MCVLQSYFHLLKCEEKYREEEFINSVKIRQRSALKHCIVHNKSAKRQKLVPEFGSRKI